jgi:YqaJ-like viral recombinase domain
MPKYFSVVQGSEEWKRLRMGRPTASAFDRIIQPKKHEPTKGETRLNYQIFLLTELIMDMPLSGVTTAALEFGHEYEDAARALYEMETGQDVIECGFVTDDAMTYGASPDSFVGEDGSLEIKSCFKPEIHVGYLMNPQSLVDAHFVQTQGQLFVTERKWTDLVSYARSMPMVKVRVLPNPEFQEKLAVAVRSFCAEFSDLCQRAFDAGYLKKLPAMTGWVQEGDGLMVRAKRSAEDPHGLNVSDEDVTMILKANKRAQEIAST